MSIVSRMLSICWLIKRYADKNVEEISSMVGFANRQSFYAAFYKNVGETPNGFRKRNMEKIKY